jgi:asparagine synthase (glutamine-hydrolysing)
VCGIVGLATAAAAGEPDWLGAAVQALHHRGPDDARVWTSPDRRVSLGHRRLAIIDLSPAGQQPMLDVAGELCIAFNGEIYNFRELRTELAGLGHAFRSQSDTEVVLAAYRQWGRDCLGRLNGMFALALHDTRKGELILARDRAGEKPLYYRLEDGALRFASELKGLLADPALPRRIDPLALDCYLAFGYVPGDGCLLQGYRKLAPAHALCFDTRSGRHEVWRYWSLPALAGDAAVDETALLDQLEALLADAVARQLVADVPVGVLLSGGVDSSLVTAMAVRASPRVKTFTVGFPGFGRYDEREHARLVAGHFGTEHVELEAGSADPALLGILARQYDEPIIDSSMLPTYLVSRLVREHCTVALGGDGGDELFGGYPHHSRLAWLAQRLGRVPHVLRRPWGRLAEAVLPVGYRGRNWLLAAAGELRDGLPLVNTHFDAATRLALLGPSHAAWLGAERLMHARLQPGRDIVQRATRTDFGNYMADEILVKVDRASMLASLEVRAPLLDYRIVEFAFGRVPSHLKATPHDRKILLKRLAARVLPPEFDKVRKQGFSIPLGHWLRAGPWRALFEEVLFDADSIFDGEASRALLRGQDAGAQNGERLFGLVMLELWRREYGCTL